MLLDFKWFTVVEDRSEPGRKTRRLEIVSKSGGDVLGTIKWFGRWRQYCFFPKPDTVWSDGCIADLMTVLTKLAAERKSK